MLRVVDATETHVIQKVVHDREGTTLGYQVVPKKGVEGKPQRVSTLQAARTLAARVIVHPVKETAPKSSYPQKTKVRKG